ncbi:MAG: TIGR04283 family arsenosugar biosynthesis glycosyltransferase [Paracoccaceae bacterium]
MRAPISVVIPTLNAANSLPACLAALVEGLNAGLIRELIISDGGSEEDTHALADAWGATVVSGPPSRGGQLRRGCEAAKGEWFLILHADTILSEGWSDVVHPHLRTNKAGWFRLRFDKGGRIIAMWANIRSRWGLPYGDQGLLIPARLYSEVGGYDDIPLMEDVALARALKGKLAELPAIAFTSAERYRTQGWIKRSARNFWTLIRYFAGVSPHDLARRYNRH